MAWRRHKASFCPGCGEPKATAWHPDNDGHFAVTQEITCHGCTAKVAHGHEGTEPVKPVTYLLVEDTRDYAADPLPELVIPRLTA